MFISLFSIGIGSFSAHAADTWKSTLHGDLEVDSDNYEYALGPTNRYLETARFSLDETIKYGKKFKIKLDPLLQADPLDHSPSERYWFDVPAGYVQYQASGFTLQLGMNTYTWGVTDGYNPLDVVSAKRYQDPLKADKLGAPSAYVKKEFGKFSVEGIYIPFQRRSILPGENSRWLPREVLSTTSIGSGTQSATLYLPPNLDYSYLQYQERDRALENNVGMRMQVDGILKGLDASLEGFEGAAGTPAIDVGASGVGTFTNQGLIIHANPLVNLTPVYYRQQVAGGSLVYANFGMIFRAEAAITRVISRGSDLPGHADEWVFGIERPVTVASRDLTVLLQGTYARHEDPLSNSTTSLNRIFDRAGILGFRYSFSEKLSAMASGLYDTESHGELAHLEAAYSINDAWKVGIAGDALWGDPSTPLGSYNKNDRIIVSAKTAF